MIRGLIFTLLVGLSGYASAHQLTPTYPKLEKSHIEGVLQTTMRLFNRRADIEYYELSVHDADWNRIPFASRKRILYVDHLSTLTFDVFIREVDRDRATYICTLSKNPRRDDQLPVISSRICSKIK